MRLTPEQEKRQEEARLAKAKLVQRWQDYFELDLLIYRGTYEHQNLYASVCKECRCLVLGTTNNPENLELHDNWHKELNA